MKVNLLIGAMLLTSISLIADDIEKDMSYQLQGVTFHEYILNGKNEECSIVYVENKKLDSTTCVSLTNSQKIEILCTKNKSICKTKKEVDDFVKPSILDDTSTQISKILKNWVKAHNNNDMKLLSNLYAKELTYYGKKLTRKKCIKDKTRALKKYSNFHQSLEEIDYSEVTPNIYKVTFNKLVKLKEDGELDVYPSYLLIDTSISSILVEGDEVTDTNKKYSKSKKDTIPKLSISENKSNACSNIINADVFRKTNPYKLKGKCVKGHFEVQKVTSENTALGYNLLQNYNSYNFQPIGTTTGKRAVHITAKGNLGDKLTDGAEISGLFKITGTEKLDLINGGEVIASSLLWISN